MYNIQVTLLLRSVSLATTHALLQWKKKLNTNKILFLINHQMAVVALSISETLLKCRVPFHPTFPDPLIQATQ